MAILCSSREVRCLTSAGTYIQLGDDKINDGYCDCDVNGEDEDRTSACSFLQNSMFTCENKDDKPVQIYSSRVDDGVGRFSCVFRRFVIAVMEVTKRTEAARTRVALYPFPSFMSRQSVRSVFRLFVSGFRKPRVDTKL